MLTQAQTRLYAYYNSLMFTRLWPRHSVCVPTNRALPLQDRTPLVPAASTASRAQQTPPLVLGHAINMASLAFQAYLEPAAGAEFQKRSASATMTQYTNAEIVSAHYSAVLNVTIGQATGFKGSDVSAPAPPPLTHKLLTIDQTLNHRHPSPPPPSTGTSRQVTLDCRFPL